MIRHAFTLFLILLAVASRLVPHIPNVTPVTALALFGGVYLDRKQIFLIPILAMLLSDFVLGFHSGMPWVYASFLAIGCIGLWLRNHPGLLPTVGATFAGSLLFFIVTNFGVWFTSQVVYPRTMAGLMECYTAGIPFFRNTLAGDAAYVALLFGIYELAARVIPSLAPPVKRSEA